MKTSYLLLAGLTLAGCEPRRSAEPRTSPAPQVAAAIPASRALESDKPFVDLELDGFDSSIVSLPRGATEKKPVLVVGHGLGDSPEAQCEAWRGIIEDRGFILCPRGIPHGTGFAYGTPDRLYGEIKAGLAALQKKYPEHVADGPVVYAGFSLGANYGANVIAKEPALFTRAILIEASPGRFTKALARQFAENGGQKVHIACGQGGCNQDARGITAALEGTNADVHVTYAEGAGHTMGGPVYEHLKREFEWIVEGDARWKK
jgi:pimeloyl-ACP methyl ester carboxylesterase